MAEVTAEKKGTRVPLHVYKCPICKEWHLTKKVP